MARRRASIATISRPIGPGQDATKDGIRQRNSVSGRVTLRRPSFNADAQRWEEKLNRTESSNSVVELRQIFEQAESRRGSIEENNNMRLQVINNNNINCEVDTAGSQALEVWPCIGEDTVVATENNVDLRQGSRFV